MAHGQGHNEGPSVGGAVYTIVCQCGWLALLLVEKWGTGTHLSNGGGAVRGRERGLLVDFRHFPRSHNIDIIDLSSSDLFTNMSHLLNLCRLFPLFRVEHHHILSLVQTAARQGCQPSQEAKIRPISTRPTNPLLVFA